MKLLPILSASALLVSASTSGADPTVLAKVGNAEIKVEDVRASLEGIVARERAALNANPALLSQVVRSLLVQRLVLQEAQAKRWAEDPAIARQLERVREKAIIESYLQSVSRPPEEFPSGVELQAAYDANKAALLVPRQFRLAQIFIAAPKSSDKAASDKVQAKLESVRKALKAKDVDFAAVAKAESEERASAEKGGEIGWLIENQVQPEIRSKLATLATNAVSEPIKLADGWHMVKVLEIKEAYLPELAEIREVLALQLRAERTKVNSQAYVARLTQENPVSVNELALPSVLAK